MKPISCNQESRKGGDEEGFPAQKSCRVLLGIRGKWEKAGVAVWAQSMIHHSHGMLALSPDSHARTPARPGQHKAVSRGLLYREVGPLFGSVHK